MFKSTWRVAATCFLGLLLLAFATKVSSQYSRLAVGSWWLSLPFVLFLIRIAVRTILRNMRHQGFNIRRVAIVGTGKNALQLDGPGDSRVL